MSEKSIEEQKESIIKSLDKDFVEKATKIFYDAQNNKVKNKIEKLSYRKVDQTESEKLKKDIGLDLNGYEHNITNMDIRHIYKNHGDEKIEDPRGQIAIHFKDILLIPEITKNYDSVRLQGKDENGRYVIEYRKRIGSRYYFIETVGGIKRKELRSKTMWIVK